MAFLPSSEGYYPIVKEEAQQHDKLTKGSFCEEKDGTGIARKQISSISSLEISS
jgi:hypothetical protein